MSPERQAAIGVGIKKDEIAFLDLAELARVDDSRVLINWFAERKSPRTVVMIDSRDPAAAFVNELRARGVKVNVISQSDAGKAFVGFTTAVSEARIWHVDQPVVRAGLKIARAKAIGKGGLEEWDLDDPTAEVAAVRAMTLAHYGLSLEKKRTGNGRSSSNRTAVVL
jgi:phage terminase large subunit-like protein